MANAQTQDAKHATVDRLLDALKTAPDESTASAIEAELEQFWLHAGSPAVTLLISRGLRSLQAGENDEAVASFSDAIILQPDVAAAWRERAVAKYHNGDLDGAIRDLEQTLQREPRDFAAFRALAEIAAARSDWKAAYEAWLKLMEIDPKTPGGESELRVLKRKALGEDT